MEGNQNYNRRLGKTSSDPRVKPCSVVLHTGEVENYLGRKRKLEPLFEIQKVALKTELDGDVTPPDLLVNTAQNLVSSSEKPILGNTDSNNLSLCKNSSECSEVVLDISNNASLQEAPILFQIGVESSSSNSNIRNRTQTRIELLRKKVLTIVPPLSLRNLEFSLHFEFSSKILESEMVYEIPFKLGGSENVKMTYSQIISSLKRQEFWKQPNNPHEHVLYCLFCLQKFASDAQSFYRHFKLVHRMQFRCFHCKSNFKDLKCHASLKHNFKFSFFVLELLVTEKLKNHFQTLCFHCLYCLVVFENVDDLFEHVQRKHHICRICSEIFESEIKLIEHNYNHSMSKIRYFTCKKCGVKFYEIDRIKEHKICSSEPSISQEIVLFPLINHFYRSKCPYCPLSFVKLSLLYVHLLGHTTQNCVTCYKTFVNSRFLENKFAVSKKCMRCNMNDINQFNSDHINMSVSKLSDSWTEITRHLNNENYLGISFLIIPNPSSDDHQNAVFGKLEQQKITFCAFDLELKLEMLKNRNWIEKSAQIYNCLFCDATCLSANDFYNHFVDCVSLILQCDICQLSSKSLTIFLDHMMNDHEFYVDSTDCLKVLLGEIIFLKTYEITVKPLFCLFCNDLFHDVSKLVNHVTSNHFNCKNCGVTFSCVRNYFKHITNYDRGLSTSLVCKLCKTATTCATYAKDHVSKFHNGTPFNFANFEIIYKVPMKNCYEKSYHCPYCPQYFVEELDLRKHFLDHAVLMCKVCSKQFCLPNNCHDSVNLKCVNCIHFGGRRMHTIDTNQSISANKANSLPSKTYNFTTTQDESCKLDEMQFQTEFDHVIIADVVTSNDMTNINDNTDVQCEDEVNVLTKEGQGEIAIATDVSSDIPKDHQSNTTNDSELQCSEVLTEEADECANDFETTGATQCKHKSTFISVFFSDMYEPKLLCRKSITVYPLSCIITAYNTLVKNEPEENPLFRCAFCDIHYEVSLENLCLHLVNKHKMKVNCKSCYGLSAVFLENIQDHLIQQHGLNAECANNLNLCVTQLLTNQDKLDKTQLVKYARECLFCTIRFADSSLLYRHIKRSHHYCTKCGMLFNSHLELSSHTNIHDAETVQFFKCSMCDSKFISVDLLDAHFEHHHFELANTLHDADRYQVILRVKLQPKSNEPAELHETDKLCVAHNNNCPYCFSITFETEFQLAYHILQKHVAVVPTNSNTIPEDVVVDSNLRPTKVRPIHKKPTTKFPAAIISRSEKNLVVLVSFSKEDTLEPVAKYGMGCIKLAHNTLTKNKQDDCPLYKCDHCVKHYELSLINLCLHFLNKHNMKITCYSCFGYARVGFDDIANHLLGHQMHSIYLRKLNLYITYLLSESSLKLNKIQIFQFARTCLFCCKSTFDHTSLLYDHIEKCHNYCKACGIQFYADVELRAHLNLHATKKVVFYKCSMCDAGFGSCDLVNAHFDHHHTNVLNKTERYSVSFSMLPAQSFTKKPSILRRKTDESVVACKNKCPYCFSIEYETEYQLACHIIQNHEAIKCQNCSENFILSAVIKFWMTELLFQNCYRCILYSKNL